MDRAWQRLGDLLLHRRVALGYPNRQEFVRDRGLKHDRTISDLENAKRDNYERATLAQVEQVYEWQAGSIAAVLRGGDPTPMEDVLGIRVTHFAAPDPTIRAEIQKIIDDLPDRKLPGALKLLETLVD